MMENQHIILFGASGATGIVFIKHFLTLTNPPFVTLYVRSTSKLTSLVSGVATHPRIRIIEGDLTSSTSLTKALTPSAAFPAVTAAISFLGAYMSFKSFITRDTSTPIANALRSIVLPTLARSKVERILVLSTPSFLLPGEAKSIPWKHYINSFLPPLMVPQGNAEMKAIAGAVIEAGGEDGEWTVFRVPFLDDREGSKIVDGTFLQRFEGSTALSRGAMVRWLLDEVVDRKWIRGVPMLANKE